jgi:CBS-domain-containing membrane protein
MTTPATTPRAKVLAPDTIAASSVAHADRGLTRAAAVPDLIWIPTIVGGLIFIIGVTGWLIGKPWLFASLGPTAYLLAHSPSQASARPYNVIAGHLIGVCAACAAVALFGAGDAPSVFTTHVLVGSRVLASGLGLVIAVAVELLLNASHPPAAATVLLITLGGLSISLDTVTTILIGVLLLILIGEPLRRMRRAP